MPSVPKLCQPVSHLGPYDSTKARSGKLVLVAVIPAQAIGCAAAGTLALLKARVWRANVRATSRGKISALTDQGTGPRPGEKAAR